MLKPFIAGILALALSFSVIGTVAAQEPPRTRRTVMQQFVIRLIVHETATATRTEPKDVWRAFNRGQTINEYISEYNADADNIRQAVMVAVNERIQQAVENERIDDTAAQRLLTEIEEGIVTFMNSPGPADPVRTNSPGARRILFAVHQSIITETAAAADTQPREVLQAWRDGISISIYLRENGVEPDIVIAAVLDAIRSRLDYLVQAGQLTEVQVGELIERFEAGLPEIMDRTRAPLAFGHNHLTRNRPANQTIDILIGRVVVVEAAKAVNFMPQDIVNAARGGKSILEIVIEAGGDIDAVHTGAVTELEDLINQALMDDKITQPMADRLLNNLDSLVTRYLSSSTLR